VPIEAGLRIESRHFTNLLLHPTARNMIRSLFLSLQELNKGARRPKDVPPSDCKKLGILGAGMMGAGIAYVSANAGIEVVLIDQTQDAADKGRAYSEALLDKGISRKRVTPEKKDEVLSRITATTDLAALAGCDLIVEAVFEDPQIKAEITRKVDAVVGEDCIFATNTSTLPISELAKCIRRGRRHGRTRRRRGGQ
jgi:3-hydroxyacyl-CoA dehydrogenase/enoyl-CoA hydratase/3-hydroxybutyryl-CoA epimerase